MDQRRARATTLVAVTLSLLVGCGPSTGASDGLGSSPAEAPRSSPAGPGASAAPSADVTVSTTPGPDVGIAAQDQVRAATTKFVRTVLTIGYPDRTYRQYTDRIEPLMTTSGFEALQSAGATSKGSEALTSLYAQRSRSAPRFTSEVEVTSLAGDEATAQLAYENVAQRRDGRGWRTVRSLGEGTATVRLVRQGKRWLVEDAS